MKKLLFFLLIIIASLKLSAQHAPVAVDDTITIGLADSVVVNVVKNDYHPDGVPFRISSAGGHEFTDSTITLYLNYDRLWAWTKSDTSFLSYFLVDDNGNSTMESLGHLYFNVDNQPSAFLDTNNVKARVSSADIQFWKTTTIQTNLIDELGYFFPKDGHKASLFSSSFWIGGLDDEDNIHLAAERYRITGLDYWPGPVSVIDGEVTADVSNAVNWNRVWKLTKDEIIYHKFHYSDPGYQPIEAIATWPAHGDVSKGQAEYIAPFVDVDGNGVYEPMQGDYPLIRGDQCIFFVLNDARVHDETDGGLPLGIEVHVMAYEFYNADTLAMHNTVFYSYKVFNRSANTYHNTIMGLYSDLDIGYAWDDYIGCDVFRGLFYGYNGIPVDGNGEPEAYGDTVPAQTIILLSSGLMDADGEDNPAGVCDESINGTGFDDGIIDNERFGMKRFVYFNSGGNPAITDPRIATDYYQYMNGLWKDSTAIEYGGTGHVSGGAYGPAASFAFPGMSDSCYWGTGGEEPYGPVDWSMNTAGLEPGDVRGAGLSGKFTFKPGDMQRFDVAYVSAFAEEGKTALETVLDYSGFVKAKYMEDPDNFGYQYLGVKDVPRSNNYLKLNVWPNPVKDKLMFVSPAKHNEAVYTVKDITGKVVYNGFAGNKQPVVVDMSGWPGGLYIINVKSQDGVFIAKVIKQ